MKNESRMFRMMNVPIERIVDSLSAYLQMQKGMEVQSARTTEGFVVQASQPNDGWKTISGTRLAITIYMTVINDVLNVTIGEGQWSDKVGASVIGWFVAWPLAVTALAGTIRQKNLPSEIFSFVERTIYTGGNEVMIHGSGAVLGQNEVACPNCKTRNPAGAQFCNNCGTKLNFACPECGARIEPNMKFCNQCGAKLNG